MAAVVAIVSVMSGTGDRARSTIPAMVADSKPATTPTAGLKTRAPIQAVARTTPSAATPEVRAAVRCVTAPAGQEPSAISHAWRGGLFSMGTPPISGKNQRPVARMSRAITGNRASSLVASTRAPVSKKRRTAPPIASSHVSWRPAELTSIVRRADSDRATRRTS